MFFPFASPLIRIVIINIIMQKNYGSGRFSLRPGEIIMGLVKNPDPLSKK
jgi:hypothetical protein